MLDTGLSCKIRKNQNQKIDKEMGNDMDIPIIYEDDALIICNKPAGLAVQTRSLGQKDLESMLKNYRASKNEPPDIGVVHRLDQPVQGLLVFAKTKEAAADLSRQMAGRLADKYYYAMVSGVPQKKSGTLEDYLLRDGKNNTSSVVERGTPGAKRAELTFEVLEAKGGRSVLRIRLATGRHHQIRVQLAHAGWPIIGDKKYNFAENISPSETGLSLCSYKIILKHPVTRRKLEFEIDKPFTLS